ncbi:MAG: hypothetical protein WCA23_33540, partial [Stellaceae bacterium]
MREIRAFRYFWPTSVIDGEITVRIDGIERVVVCLEGIRQRHLAERVKDADLLAEAVGILRATSTPAGCD